MLDFSPVGLPLLRRIQHLAHDSFARLGYGLERLSFPGKQERLRMVRRIRANRSMLITPTEAWFLVSLLRSVKNVRGEMAEVGTYRGATASLLAEAEPNKSLYVFDTFSGLPSPSRADGNGSWAYSGNFDVGFEEVKSYLSKWTNIRIYRGLFPGSARALGDLRFSFVHLDVDLYDSTLSSLEWFYPRMTLGGIVITHDYDFCPGVKKAFDEFLADKSDTFIELPTNQAMIIRGSAL